MMFRRVALFVAVLAAVVGCARFTLSSTATPAQSVATVSPPSTVAEEADITGNYTLRYEDGSIQMWKAEDCGPGCADITAKFPQPWDGQAHLDGNQWTLLTSSPQGIACDDGTLLASTETFTWDTKSMRGVYTRVQALDGCGLTVGTVDETAPFSISKNLDSGSKTPSTAPTKGKVTTY
jgi:hypothetical protein